MGWTRDEARESGRTGSAKHCNGRREADVSSHHIFSSSLRIYNSTTRSPCFVKFVAINRPVYTFLFKISSKWSLRHLRCRQKRHSLTQRFYRFPNTPNEFIALRKTEEAFHSAVGDQRVIGFMGPWQSQRYNGFSTCGSLRLYRDFASETHRKWKGNADNLLQVPPLLDQISTNAFRVVRRALNRERSTT